MRALVIHVEHVNVLGSSDVKRRDGGRGSDRHRGSGVYRGETLSITRWGWRRRQRRRRGGTSHAGRVDVNCPMVIVVPVRVVKLGVQFSLKVVFENCQVRIAGKSDREF